MKLLLNIYFLLLGFGLLAQNGKVVRVELTNPSQPGYLSVDNHNGTVSVMGYDGSEVIVTVDVDEDDDDNDWEDRKRKGRSGLKRIPNRSAGVSIVEENNHVYVSSSHNTEKHYTIKVPRQMSLSIGTHHNGQITVEGVYGSHELDAHHGGIEAKGVRGAVIADTHHGDIIIEFLEIENDLPMAFSTYHGDVDITLPASARIDTKMKTRHGDIYTDFDMTTTASKMEQNNEGARKVIKFSEWTFGKIGGGGVEYLMDTYHGDIIIRKL